MFNLDTLITRWSTGDQYAAEMIYNHYRNQTFGLAYALLNNSADAEEVAQDVLTYALVNIARYDPEKSKFTTWLHTITVSRCRNRRRRQFLPSISLFAWLSGGGDKADKSQTPEALAVSKAEQDEIWAVIQTLKHPLREAILLRYWHNCTYQEIADIVGCSMRTAQSRVRLAHQHLHKHLAINEFDKDVIPTQ